MRKLAEAVHAAKWALVEVEQAGAMPVGEATEAADAISKALAPIGDDRRADHSSGLICALWEALDAES